MHIELNSPTSNRKYFMHQKDDVRGRMRQRMHFFEAFEKKDIQNDTVCFKLCQTSKLFIKGTNLGFKLFLLQRERLHEVWVVCCWFGLLLWWENLSIKRLRVLHAAASSPLSTKVSKVLFEACFLENDPWPFVLKCCISK